MTGQCYANTSNGIAESQWKPCGAGNSTTPYIPCCASTDTCLAHGLCHYTHSLTNGSGYYISSCTDPTYNAKNCPKACVSSAFPDVTWNDTARLWQCCAGTNSTFMDCEKPSRESFDAPGPNFVRTYWPPVGKEKGGGVSGGIIGGVIAVVLVVVGLLVAGGLVWRRRKRRDREKEGHGNFLLAGYRSEDSNSRLGVISDPGKSWVYSSSGQLAELQDSVEVVELEVRHDVSRYVAQQSAEAVELPGPSPVREVVVSRS